MPITVPTHTHTHTAYLMTHPHACTRARMQATDAASKKQDASSSALEAAIKCAALGRGFKGGQCTDKTGSPIQVRAVRPVQCSMCDRCLPRPRGLQ